MSAFKLLLVSFLITIFLKETYGLYCITCTSYNSNCGTTVTDSTYMRYNMEPCNRRCFIRTDSSGVVTRGCDIGYYFSSSELTTTNGCITKNGEYWCFCTTGDLCNTANTAISSSTSSGRI